jgi:hypothetical protein
MQRLEFSVFKPLLYGLWRLEEAQKAGFVWLVEGESDAHSMWFHGVPALGLPGASNWKEERDAVHLDGIYEIFVTIEPDRGGEALLKWLARSSLADRAKLVHLEGVKDLSELHLGSPATFEERVREAMETATLWSEHEAAKEEQRRQEAWARCKQLATQSFILDHFVAAVRPLGLVGEDVAAQVVYLALTSRRLPRQVNVVLKGPSSGGKNTVLEKTLEFFPESAVHVLTGLSEHSLAYDDEPIAHRFLVIFEAAGISGERATYFIRSLLSEGRLRYLTVEKTKDGLRRRLIEREGPTGLLITTTAVSLHPENETRLLSVSVTDTPEQTRRVLEALGREDVQAVDLGPWVALQEWIEGGKGNVTVPFASRLAKAIPDSALAVRLRRDFNSLLMLIRAHALLHQATREKDHRDRIVATLDDYAVVRRLVADVLAQGLDATVPPSIRETVEAVGRVAGGGAGNLTDRAATVQQSAVSVTKLATELRLDKSATSRRVRHALERGYLRNLEDRKGRPHRLVVGDQMPENVEVLPRPEVLQCCKVDGRDERGSPQATDGDGPVSDLQVADAEQERLPMQDEAEGIEVVQETPMSVDEIQASLGATDITEDLRQLRWIKRWNRSRGVASPEEWWESPDLGIGELDPFSPDGDPKDVEAALLYKARAFSDAGWTTGPLMACIVCGHSAAARDPQGRVRHPGCLVET